METSGVAGKGDGCRGQMGARDVTGCVFFLLFVITGLTMHTSKYFMISIIDICVCLLS